MKNSRTKFTEKEIEGLQKSLEASPGLAVVGYAADGTITCFDGGAERLFGYKPEMVVGQATYEVLHAPEDFVRFFNPGILSNPERYEIEVDALTRTRDLVPVKVTLQPTGGKNEETAWVALYRDQSPVQMLHQQLEAARHSATARNSQTEKEAEFLRELLGRTMQTIQIGLAVQEMDSGMIAYANQGFEDITGLRQLEMMGNSFSNALADYEEARDRVVNYVQIVEQAVQNGETPPPRMHWEFELPTGNKVIEAYGQPLALEGHPGQYLLLILEDHTDRHRLQMQLVQSEKLAAVGQLAAGIAHELRNPLNTIFNALYDLNEIVQPRTNDVAEDIGICMDEIKRVQDIITNLLDFAREGERSTGQTDLNDVLERTIRLVQHDLSGKSVEAHCDLDPDIPQVAINNNALKQILINLITNATQAMSEGGTLTLRTSKRSGPVPFGQQCHGGKVVKKSDGRGRLRLAEIPGPQGEQPAEAPEAKEHVIFTITDNGPGITSENLADIFNPFFTTKEPGSGTGLGLSVVHALVRDARGAVSVESAPGQGTTFTIELPAVAAEG